MKICFPSKNKAAIITTHLFFEPKDVLIFVEPQEVKRYEIFWPEYTIIDIKKSEQGLIYARNFIFDYITEDKIVMADDDVYFFGVRTKEGRYDETLFNHTEFFDTIEKGLDLYWGYNIPRETFAYFTNQSLKAKRFTINSNYLSSFCGLNIKKLKENNIYFDSNLDLCDDIDMTTQIILNDGNVCTDYMYAIKHEMRKSGGMADVKKIEQSSLDSSLRAGTSLIAKKYGFEFLKMSHDKDGYFKFYYLDFKLLQKRKEIAKENLKEYLTKT